MSRGITWRLRMAVSYSFGAPGSVGGRLSVADGELASLADWLTDSMRLAGSGGEWSAGDPWSGLEGCEISRAWLHDPLSAEPPIRGFRVLCMDGSVVGLPLSAARAWRNDLREGATGAFPDGVVSADHIV